MGLNWIGSNKMDQNGGLRNFNRMWLNILRIISRIGHAQFLLFRSSWQYSRGQCFRQIHTNRGIRSKLQVFG